ncbi:hypothetical protein WN51_10366 [Melipona quadrifasciata]|uniref:Uncharacterized protein n=1 Tax=Melipona quadrifasciata TaxID=166423 RepID=A0A0N0U6U9_9HYME|nr:hypothetical protein WN51_10366 [Melipona quadrifasciata]
MDVRESWRIEAKRACLDCRENLSSRIPPPPPPPPPPPQQPVDRAAEKRGEPIGRFSANDAELRGEQVIAGTDSKQAEVGEQPSGATDCNEKNDPKEGEDDEVRIGQAGTLEAETFCYLAAGQPAGEQPSDVCREQLVLEHGKSLRSVQTRNEDTFGNTTETARDFVGKTKALTHESQGQGENLVIVGKIRKLTNKSIHVSTRVNSQREGNNKVK